MILPDFWGEDLRALLVVNYRRIDQVLLKMITEELRQKGIDSRLCSDENPDRKPDVDILMTFGGDGTVLRAVRTAIGQGLPILSFRAGSVGFLTSFDMEHFTEALDLLVRGQLIYDRRRLLEIGMGGSPYYVLNDCVIERGTPSRTVSLQVKIEGFDSYHIAGDGVVVSTSTGSTAYSLAAGGPVIDPAASVYCITPISPHNPYVGSMVVSGEKLSTIGVISGKGYPVNVYGDGLCTRELNSGDALTVILSEKGIVLLRKEPLDYVEVLRRKLAFGGRLKNGF